MAGRRTFFFEGLGVSAGVAIGPAYVLEPESYGGEGIDLASDEIEEEIERFEKALDLAREEVRLLGKQVAEKIDRQQAAIFDAHLLMLEDPQIVDSTVARIRSKRQNAESVLWEITRDLGDQMKALGDPYFAERNHDLFDISRRIIKFLRELRSPTPSDTPREGCIVVAHNLGPGETAQLSRDRALGFCTNEGGATSHAAILAKALSIPAVVGLEFVTHYIRTGDRIILDGSAGKVILNPTAEQIRHYEEKQKELAQLRVALGELRDLPAISTDETHFSLLANIELPEELDSVEQHGAEGIGLYRTEYLYLHRDTLPSEEDHLREYKLVLERLEGKPVVMRTLDLGGDKMPGQLGVFSEQNPFMGLRAIRLCLARPEIYRIQLRAMLMAAAGRELSIMIPMVSTLEEIRATRRMIDEIQENLLRNGHDVPSRLQLGAMIEIPSAAIQTRDFCREVDFVSIGTNDLVQYALAVDRVNKSVASLYRECHPGVLKLIRIIAEQAAETSTPVSVCGEMASDPRLAILLAGLGIRTFSMSSSSLPVVKRALRAISITESETLAREALTMTTPEEVERLLEERLGPVFQQFAQSAVLPPEEQDDKSADKTESSVESTA